MMGYGLKARENHGTERLHENCGRDTRYVLMGGNGVWGFVGSFSIFFYSSQRRISGPGNEVKR